MSDDNVYYTPAMKWQYLFSVVINGYEYQFGDREPMITIEDAQAALTYAVESFENKHPVNILGPLEGDFETPQRFEGRIWFADDLPDGSDYDPDTKRFVDVVIVCAEVRHNTEME